MEDCSWSERLVPLARRVVFNLPELGETASFAQSSPLYLNGFRSGLEEMRWRH